MSPVPAIHVAGAHLPGPVRVPDPTPAGNTAVVYCEANFGAGDGKTANGLVRHSEKYKILSVIDSEKDGLDSGEVLDGVANGIPICGSLTDAITLAGTVPDFFILGMAPASGMLSRSSADWCSMRSRTGCTSSTACTNSSTTTSSSPLPPLLTR